MLEAEDDSDDDFCLNISSPLLYQISRYVGVLWNRIQKVIPQDFYIAVSCGNRFLVHFVLTRYSET
jgi:hypothetical protein